MRSLRLVQLLSTLALATVTGCAGASGEDAAGSGDALTAASEAITLQNWEGHPRLQAIAELRAEIFPPEAR